MENFSRNRESKNGAGESHLSQHVSKTQKNCLAPVKKSCECTNGLHHYNCLPTHLMSYNKYIRTGYRLDLTTWECIKSLFYLHNESFNVLSHGLAAIAFVLITPYVYSNVTLLQFDPILFPMHHITCFTCVLFSATYHLMMCHNGGNETYRFFIMLDYFGIWMVTGINCLTFLKAMFFCFPLLNVVTTLMYFTIAVFSFIKVTKASNAETRLQPLIYLGAIRLLVVYPCRCVITTLGYTTGPLGAVRYLLAVEIIGLAAGVINLACLPEKWFYGKLDYIFNSHNIMHVLVLFGAPMLHFGAVVDFEWMKRVQCPL